MRHSLFFCFLLFSISFVRSASSQTIKNSISLSSDSLNSAYEKILLDGQTSYRSKITNEIISPAAYMALSGNKKDTSAQYISLDHWQNDRVNPYRGASLSTPFKIEFDQTTFTHPVDGEIVVTSRFGRRRRGPHRGLDLDLVTGDTVRTILPGKVRFVGYSRGHGKTVVVRHANEIETVYAHLSDYDVKENDIIAEGQIIGKGGNTGRSRGSHLHLEVRYKGICIHPEYVFNFDGSRMIRGTELWVTTGWKSPRMHSSYQQSKLVPLHTESDALAAQAAEPRYHKVARGDTLSEIAQRYSLRIRDLCSLNRISKSSILRIGQIIQVR